jgi:BirA family biotin operon repressor/biotin-[acetyl-CoA-carboxylase] ligase
MSFGHPHRHYTQCKSTNDLARAWAESETDPAPHGALVTADFQTQGRGRRGSRWEASAAESALMSFVLRPAAPLSDLWQLGFVVSLAAADALGQMGFAARLKWPNDLLLNDAKVGGILVETVSAASGALNGGAAARIAIAGIGINLNQSDFPVNRYAYPPISLKRAAGAEQDPQFVIRRISHALAHWDAVWQRDGKEPVISAWRDRMAVGALVRNGEDTAQLLDISAEGHALVETPQGAREEWITSS